MYSGYPARFTQISMIEISFICLHKLSYSKIRKRPISGWVILHLHAIHNQKNF